MEVTDEMRFCSAVSRCGIETLSSQPGFVREHERVLYTCRGIVICHAGIHILVGWMYVHDSHTA